MLPMWVWYSALGVVLVFCLVWAVVWAVELFAAALRAIPDDAVTAPPMPPPSARPGGHTHAWVSVDADRVRCGLCGLVAPRDLVLRSRVIVRRARPHRLEEDDPMARTIHGDPS